MKRTILFPSMILGLVIVFMLSLPCTAAEPEELLVEIIESINSTENEVDFDALPKDIIDPQGLFGLNNTLWTLREAPTLSIGFTGGFVYLCDTSGCLPLLSSKITNLILISFFSGSDFSGSLNGYASSILGIGSLQVCIFGEGCIRTPIVKTGSF